MVFQENAVFKALFRFFLLEGDGPAIDLPIQFLLGIFNRVSENSTGVKRGGIEIPSKTEVLFVVALNKSRVYVILFGKLMV